MLSVENLFSRIFSFERSPFFHPDGDHLSLLNIFNAFVRIHGNVKQWCTEHCINFKAMKQVIDIRSQLTTVCKRFTSKNSEISIRNSAFLANKNETILRCLSTGHILQCAFRQIDGSLKTLFGRQVCWHFDYLSEFL